jgi:D-sedoheptulose 7-phosphate isomerase
MTDFLYPFIEGDERDSGALLTDLATSSRTKFDQSAALRAATLEGAASELAATASAMRDRFDRGGQLFTFGNGGSSTDAAGLAALFAAPPFGAPLPARCLAEDTAVLTALGNDVGFDLIFSRQLIAHGSREDIALGLSTSGSSRNLLQAFGEAKGRGLLTIGVAGYGGGEMAVAGLDHCLVVRSDSVHRIQEVQAALCFELWKAVHGA